jgi:hypothetical protein
VGPGTPCKQAREQADALSIPFGATDKAETIGRLHRAGWSVGSAAFATEAGSQVWLVSGANGEKRIEGRDTTEAAAWRSAVEQARLRWEASGRPVATAG